VGIFKREKQKKRNNLVTLSCTRQGAHGKVTIPAPPNDSFAVRWKRLTAMVPFFAVRLAEDLCRASWTHGARQTDNAAAVWEEPGGFFFCRESTLTHNKDVRRARDKKRMTNLFCRANCCRAGFAVRRDEKRTTKHLPCVYWSLPCAGRSPVVTLHFYSRAGQQCGTIVL
jgi:hypothetical protein